MGDDVLAKITPYTRLAVIGPSTILFTCHACCAVVTDREAHTDWHAEQVAR